ncbi:hypothetical protein NCS57_01000700 [Fusarium keratoplasticum]|uniref:Uncharacterized protein n=1 Tax=Fusarium keratoplasticum TaxID=1328300 RepID=A0ACC0QNP9_9HYPO|nr:hypothetical protein NCS57_01000700 [Fusarium keratoplasticum]KAI8660241.1 hypothetical protein NCS57_01000700 [Fusarium keratoplasticum]
MTTNADYTFTPHPSPEEIQDQWSVRLLHLNDEGENQAITTHLRSIWRDNWWKYPDEIKFSFSSATFKTAITKSNAKGPSAHLLYKASVNCSRRDFDWGLWLVLRVIYYDIHQHLPGLRARQKRHSFEQGDACKLIRQRYPDVDVLRDNVPPTFPPRPHSWTILGDRGPGSSLRPETPILASTDNRSTGNQASTGESDEITDSGTDSDDETSVDESDDSPPPDNATRKVKKEAEAHTLTPDRDGGSPSRENLVLPPSNLDAAASVTPDDSTQHVNSSTSDSSPTLNDGTNKVASEQGPVGESGHHREKATDASIDSNGHSDESIGVPKSLPKRSMPEDEEEDSPCGEHTQKRRCTSSDQSHPTESEAMLNSSLQKATFGEGLDRIHELWKKTFNEKVAEIVSQQVAQRTEGLQPRIKDEMTQFLSEKIFGSTENSGLSNIAQRVIDTLAKQMASKMAQQVIQQTTQQLTRELTSKLQPEADQQLANCLTQIMMDKLFGSTGIPGL